MTTGEISAQRFALRDIINAKFIVKSKRNGCVFVLFGMLINAPFVVFLVMVRDNLQYKQF